MDHKNLYLEAIGRIRSRFGKLSRSCWSSDQDCLIPQLDFLVQSIATGIDLISVCGLEATDRLKCLDHRGSYIPYIISYNAYAMMTLRAQGGRELAFRQHLSSVLISKISPSIASPL